MRGQVQCWLVIGSDDSGGNPPFFVFQSKRSYEQRCREADEAEQALERLETMATATPKQTEKVNAPFCCLES